MAYNGSGVFARLYDWTDERDSANNIDSVKMDAEDDGFAAGLSNAITKDGQTTITANLPMATYKHTNVGAAVARTDYARADQIQDSGFQLIGSISGADTITGTLTPSISAYAAGQTYRFVAASANTGAVTLNINGAGAKAVTKAGTNALVAGDIPSGAVAHVVYDGTQFQLVPVPNISVAAAAVLDDATTGDMQTSLGATTTGKAVFVAADAAAGMAAVTPTTTRGDLIVRGASADGRLAVGASGEVLTSDGTDAAWAAAVSLTGLVMPYAGDSTTAKPAGSLLCDGSAVSRTTYAALYVITGDTYGNGDGSTTFNLPDLRGRTVVAPDDLGGSAASIISGTAADGIGTELGTHAGSFQTFTFSSSGSTSALHQANANGIVQPSLTLNYVIFT